MEIRLQYLFLIVLLLFLPLSASLAQSNDLPKVRTEYLELGLNVGYLNIEDFDTHLAIGAGLTIRATEDFFLQVNYMQASDIDLSVAEEEGGATSFLEEGDRDFKHYDLLLGYNLFQGEFFTGESKAHLSSLYLVGGIGETQFGDEERFTYTLGLGYQVAFNRRYILHFDFRDYIFDSSLIAEDASTHNTHLSVGMRYLF